MSENAIVVEDLVVRYRGSSEPSLADLTLTVPAGEWLTVIGPNGSGKTTFISALCGLVPFTGAVRVAGLVPRKARARDFARKVALLPQQPVVPAGMTVREYVRLGRYPHSTTRAYDNDIVARTLNQLGINSLAARDVANLSGGQQQIVALARAFTQESEVLLLDEPTSALDIGHAQHVLELVDKTRVERSLSDQGPDARRLTVIATVHDLPLAAQYGDRLALIAKGRLQKVGSAEEILTEETISREYGATVAVSEIAGRPAIIPVRRNSKGNTID